MGQSKAEFLEQFGGDYGYPDAPRGIDDLRAAEFKRLEGMVYLDHAGATLYSEAQMTDVARDLMSNVYGNPHSQNDPSMATSDIVTSARHQVLKYFNASPKDYKCIFTSGATAALKLVGECFPWSRDSCYMYTMENHNSVLGIREYALSKGATASAVDVQEVIDPSKSHESDSMFKVSKHLNQRRGDDVLLHKYQNGSLAPISGNSLNLFAFPSECNFSGHKFNLSLVKFIKEGKFMDLPSQQQGQWMVLIDAAKGCTTEPPNLTLYSADFVVCSFYKIFGYPTGLGALIVKNEAASLLNKTYFSGGTVAASIADIDFVQKRKSIEQALEDGTISFLSISSLRHGFKIINMLTISAIARHTASLATYVRNKMLELKHSNGKNVCMIYGQTSKVNHLKMGPTITFNLKREDDTWFGYREVEKLASLSRIHLRTGCFCNPGACAKYVGLSHSDLVSNFEAGHVCWDGNDVINGKPTGAVRISFGYMSTYEDAEEFLKFLRSSFVSKPVGLNNEYMVNMDTLNLVDDWSQQALSVIRLKSITIYPVKSCQGFSVQSWPLTTGGLKYDREWLLQGLGGEILTQKKVPELSSICTLIDLELEKLFLESPKCKDKLQISLLDNLAHLSEEVDVYGQRYEVQSYGDKVNSWFSVAIGRPCTFMRCSSSKYRSCTINGGRDRLCRDTRSKLSFVNEGQLLLVSEESISDLNSRLSSSHGNGKQGVLVDAMRFRPNIVVSGSTPYNEDNWKRLRIGEAYFTSMGGCNRCQMINQYQSSGQVIKSKEPLATLASYRRKKGKILFGVLLNYEDGMEGEDDAVVERWIKVGQEVHTYLNDDLCTYIPGSFTCTRG
ncbi:molybdenum cofactor sulfurase isoform X1 [Zea mays]|uniref:Molybdenum cofactor sulfurase n=1 Tax=Zea mays TaxID=4577 RepID=A0A804UAM0_MAIZE|nr:molybdenum cofactor sulfurase isoform X1 [Zea mays]|eukprot:XP_020394925.1 molybdenum cofactor sulfurase isoform X1 [Zea mays]